MRDLVALLEDVEDENGVVSSEISLVNACTAKESFRLLVATAQIPLLKKNFYGPIGAPFLNSTQKLAA